MPEEKLPNSSKMQNLFHPDLSDSLLPRQRKGFHLRKIPCCLVLQNENNEDVLKLNNTGALVWNLCTANNDVGGILKLLSDVFPDAKDQITRDVYRVLDTMKEYEVIDLFDS